VHRDPRFAEWADSQSAKLFTIRILAEAGYLDSTRKMTCPLMLHPNVVTQAGLLPNGLPSRFLQFIKPCRREGDWLDIAEDITTSSLSQRHRPGTGVEIAKRAIALIDHRLR
jgi:hypothetical protein